MAKTKIYLHFNGNCEEAFNYHKNIFQTEYTSFLRNKGEVIIYQTTDGKTQLNIRFNNNTLVAYFNDCRKPNIRKRHYGIYILLKRKPGE